MTQDQEREAAKHHIRFKDGHGWGATEKGRFIEGWLARAQQARPAPPTPEMCKCGHSADDHLHGGSDGTGCSTFDPCDCVGFDPAPPPPEEPAVDEPDEVPLKGCFGPEEPEREPWALLKETREALQEGKDGLESLDYLLANTTGDSIDWDGVRRSARQLEYAMEEIDRAISAKEKRDAR